MASRVIEPGLHATAFMCAAGGPRCCPLPLVYPQIVISLSNTRIIFLRKFVNNILYTVRIVRSSLSHPPSHNADATQPGAASEAATAAPAAKRGHAPVVTVQLVNTQVILPEGSAGSKGPVKCATKHNALVAGLQSVQLVVPGSREALEHVANDVANIITVQLEVRSWATWLKRTCPALP